MTRNSSTGSNRPRSSLPPGAFSPDAPDVPPPDDPFADLSPEAERAYPRNFLAFVLYMIFMRVGWIYKTESTVIPGFVTYLTANPLVIGIVPVLSRLAQFLSQFLFIGVVERTPVKRRLLLTVTTIFALSWGVLSVVLWLGGNLSNGMMLGVFFVLYGAAWICAGVERIVNRVMQGELIPARRRGRLFAIGGPLGSFSVIVSGPIIAYLLGREDAFPRNYAATFGLAFVFFAVTVGAQTLFREPRKSAVPAQHPGFADLARDGIRLLRDDTDFRRIFIVASVQSLTVYLFSYYVAYARTWSPEPAFQSSLAGMLGWGLTFQNLVVGALSLTMGLLVDWKGNAGVLRGLCAALSNVPLLVVILGRFVPLDVRLTSMLGIYALIGVAPVLGRVQNNYVLEISPQDRQALYVGIFGSGQIVTLLFPILIAGVLAVLTGPFGSRAAYEIVFLACTGLLYLSLFVAWRLREPRASSAGARPA